MTAGARMGEVAPPESIFPASAARLASAEGPRDFQEVSSLFANGSTRGRQQRSFNRN
jgi:hypothetical protein